MSFANANVVLTQIGTELKSAVPQVIKIKNKKDKKLQQQKECQAEQADMTALLLALLQNEPDLLAALKMIGILEIQAMNTIIESLNAGLESFKNSKRSVVALLRQGLHVVSTSCTKCTRRQAPGARHQAPGGANFVISFVSGTLSSVKTWMDTDDSKSLINLAQESDQIGLGTTQ